MSVVGDVIATNGPSSYSSGDRGQVPGLRRSSLLHGAILLCLAALPFVLAPYPMNVMTRILIFGLFAASLDLLVGVSGLASLGHAAYFGIGGYAAGILAIHVTSNGPAQLLIAFVAGGLGAAFVGVVLVRSRGIYFLMLTLAVGELVRQLAESWRVVTGGSNGLAGIPAATLLPGAPITGAGLLYWYALMACALGYAVLKLASASSFGVTMRGIRDNEARMRALGYATNRYKLAAFTLAGAVAGMAGALWMTQQRFLSPADLGFDVAVLALLAVVIGGKGSLWGSFVAAAGVILIRDELSNAIGGHGPLLLGIAFVLAVYLLPRGVAGLTTGRRGRRIKS